MALTRKRKEKVYPNPFAVTDEYGHKQVAWENYRNHHEYDDIIIGAVRAFSSGSNEIEKSTNDRWGQYINPQHLLKILRKEHTITRSRMPIWLDISERQTDRLLRVLKYVTPILEAQVAKLGGLTAMELDYIDGLDEWVADALSRTGGI